MPKLPLTLILFTLTLTACGFKGDLYLPKEKNKFGIIQTGIDFRRDASEPTAPAANPNDFIRTPINENEASTHD